MAGHSTLPSCLGKGLGQSLHHVDHLVQFLLPKLECTCESSLLLKRCESLGLSRFVALGIRLAGQ